MLAQRAGLIPAVAGSARRSARPSTPGSAGTSAGVLPSTRHRLRTAEQRSATRRGGRSIAASAASRLARLGAVGSRKALASVGGIVAVMR